MTNIARLLALAFFALLLLPTLACLNTYEGNGGENFNSSKSAISQIKFILSRDKESVLQDLNRHKRDYEHRLGLKRGETKRYHGERERHEAESDYAIVLLRMGKTEKAVAILERLIGEHPNEYNIVANLGTTYELTGQNEKALQYIKKGLELNKESHAGSEWIHVKILEAKIAMQTNPNWLKENAILGKEAIETAQSTDKEKIKKLIDELGFQLFERTQFIQPKDAMVGNLIMFLGDLYRQVKKYKSAFASYELAEKYTVSKPEVLQASLKEIEEKVGKASPKKTETVEPKNTPQEEPKRSPLFTVLVLAGLAVLVGGVWLMYFRSR